jgi:WD40 repeat protein/DNA-binding SARP family transcriptional activator
MPDASLTVLGAFALSIGGQPVRGFPTEKARALLAYLALEGERPHTRALLAALLWPDISETAALTNLRNTASRLRSTLDAAAPGLATALLISTRQSFQLDAALLHVDGVTFERLLAETAAHPHTALHACDACLERLAEAVGLYRGELLAGFGLADAPAFEEWLVLRREVLRRQFTDALQALASAHEQRGDYERAHKNATRLLSEDPYREEAHRQVMRLLALRGLPHQALAQYAACQRLLQNELGVEPDAQTTALFEQIKRGKETRDTRADVSASGAAFPIANRASSPLVSPSLQDWGEMPAVDMFAGRAPEQATLARWLVDERCRLIVVLGIGGVGKTTLAAWSARANALHFGAVIWRSLLNAPPPVELLRDLLQTLGADSAHALPDNLDALVRLLLALLRERRCLVVLDNAESILQPGADSGALRPGYEGYGYLLQQLGGSAHQSCLLLTSREQPLSLERLVGHTPAVRLLTLGGLDVEAGHALLQQHGLAASGNDAVALVEQYSGNPLALQIVANTIVDLFAGDVASFREEAAGVFDTIRQVLDEQWERLPENEREVLLWLAIERVPVSLATLRADLLRPPSPRVLLEAVQGLRKRSLLEQRGTTLALQNVVTEYLTERLIARVASELEGGQLEWLHRYALLKADAPEYVRQSQLRVLMEPIARQLEATRGRDGIAALARRLLDALRGEGQRQPGYAAGNLLNLLVYLGIDLQGFDFSRLCVWQADLREVAAFDVNFANTHFAHAAFSDIFDSVNGVAWSPDGSLVAAGSANGALGAWRISDGQRHALFVGQGSSVQSVCFSPDAVLLASATSDATVRLWNVTSGEPSVVLHGHCGVVTAVAFVGSTSLLVSGGADGTLRVWDTRDGRCQKVIDGFESGVRTLAVDPAGALIAACDNTSLARLWRIAGGCCVTTLAHPDVVQCVAFSPDGQRLLTGCRDSIARVWDIATGEVIGMLKGHHEHIWSASWSPNGRLIATGSHDTTIRLWDAGSGELLQVLRGHIRTVNGLDWSPDGMFLVSAGHDETVRVWSVGSGDELRTLRGNAAGVLSVAFGSDSATLYSTQGHVLRVWDVSSRRLRRILRGHRNVIYCISSSRDGAYIASAGHDHSVRVWNSASGAVLHVLAGHTDVVHAVAWSPDGVLLASASDDRTVRLWDVRTGQLVRRFSDHTQSVRAVSFSPDGALLLTGSVDQTVRVRSLGSGQTLHVLRGRDSNELMQLAVSPDGTMAAHTITQAGIVVWDVQRGEVLRELATSDLPVNCLAWSSDGKWLASGSADQSIHVWDTGSWEEEVLGYHSSWVSAVVWSPDGTLLVSSSTLGEIALWDGRTGARIGELRDAGPYAGTNIAGATGLTNAQRAALRALGAVEHDTEEQR